LRSHAKKVLCVSDSPTGTTGYGRVTRRLAYALLKAGYEITACGAGYPGGPHELPYTIIPWPDHDRASVVAHAIQSFEPQILLCIGDPWMFDFLPSLPERGSVISVVYFPIDGYPLPEAWKKWLEAIDVPVVPSHFAQKVIGDATDKPPAVIYYGVDTKSFQPQDRIQAKASANVAGHFVVGTVARNQQRKNLPALVKAFANFAADKPDTLLYLHTQVWGHWDMKELVRHFGIEDKTRVTTDLSPGRGIPDPMLSTLYNAMDIFVLPTMAEGFGLPIMEAQACGTPALATDFSACPELLPDPIQRLRVKSTLIMGRNFEQAIVDEDDISAKLEHFYRNRDELAALGRRCHEFAQQFDWSIACDQFVKLLASLPQTVRSADTPASQFKPRLVEDETSQTTTACATLEPLIDPADHAAVFCEIYRRGIWGGSGSGSHQISSVPYRHLLQGILSSGQLKRVVDLGCGDWQFSKLLDWTGIDYLGVDVVESVIEGNRKKYESDHIRFERVDLRAWNPSDADLYLVKDVLQHWTGAEVHAFLERMHGREMLITNSVTNRPYWDLARPGGFRPLDLRRPPFDLRARELLCYESTPGDVKLVLFVPGRSASQIPAVNDTEHEAAHQFQGRFNDGPPLRLARVKQKHGSVNPARRTHETRSSQ